MSKDNRRSLYRLFFPMLVVIALQQLVALTVNLVDNVMLGGYNELSLSGAAIVNQLQFMLQMVVSGIGAGVSVLGAQYWGKGEIDPIRRIISIGLKFALAAGLIFCAATLAFPRQILNILTSDIAVIAEALKYQKIMSWTYILYAASAVLMFSLRCVQTTFIGTAMSLCTVVINICLNYCLIFGNFGFPELGVEGAAIATLVSRVVELIVIVGYILKIDRKLGMKLRHLLMFDGMYLNDYIKVALPVVITGALWGVAQGAQTAILGHISAGAIAANSIASTIAQIVTVFGMSCANASSVTIGKTIGEGRMDLVKPYTRLLQMIFIVIGIISGAALFLLKDVIISRYAVTQETRELALTFLTILSISTVGSCYEYPVQSGIIAGGGDTKYAAIVDNCFMWLFSIPLGIISAFVLRLPPTVTFVILKADQLLKCIPNSIRCNRYKWVRNLTR